ncbi:T-cell surface antigen CD2 isoform X1 [Balearica regulorum gibbericeps]|uniref:T-cell surface antigen CD2 isoform X1 n=1 Tax=Balearica regulorum gibbericeps TaxID=100784 RepID=UPI0005323B4C|nr:PREDICTED: T-cell surface antigen CD2 [Balearica regulorum gibbericeps]
MNFRRTFLVKCLLLLFANVKYSVTSEIYMAVNESAFLSIAAAAGKVYDATWLKDKKKMLQLKNNSVKYYVNKEQCRCKILPNGTLQIDQVVKEDSGNYMVTVYQEDGKLKAEEAIMFIVQDPVPQPVLSAQCVNKTASVMCEVKQKTKDETFLMELTRDKSKSLQKNVTKLELHKQPSGTFRCVVKNKVSKKTAEKLIKCSELLELYLILSIAGGAIFFVIFVILLIYCIRKRKAERLEGDEEDRKMHACQTDSEMVVRELPQPQCNPTPKQLRVQQRPLPQPHVLQQAQPPRPRPRTQQRTPHHSRERP